MIEGPMPFAVLAAISHAPETHALDQEKFHRKRRAPGRLRRRFQIMCLAGSHIVDVWLTYCGNEISDNCPLGKRPSAFQLRVEKTGSKSPKDGRQMQDRRKGELPLLPLGEGR